jgi:putative effector of murein hydrolase LrgA (UPF0299 family)
MYLERCMSLFCIPATAALMKSLGITDQFLVAWLVVRLVHYLFGWSVGWLTGCLVAL